MPGTKMYVPSVTYGALDLLKAHTQGKVIVVGDEGYEDARKAWNLTVDQHPAVIVAPNSVIDVVEAVLFAREEGLSVAVQSTGHGVVRPADDSLLLLTSNMDQVRVDADTRSAWVEAGVKWGKVLAEAQQHGLAPLLGSSPNVGAIGYTLGGGMGWLARKYGLAADSVLCFELVTPEGRLIYASANENSDLYWALRGGGGNFGVVTGIKIRLFAVEMVYGGRVTYPIELAREVFARFRDWAAAAPDELTASIVIMNMPPLPQVPEPMRGKSFISVLACYSGPMEDADDLFRVWNEWKPAVMNSFGAMPFSEVASISADPEQPMPGLSTGAWLSDLNDDTVEILLRNVVSVNGSSPIGMTEIRLAGGAVSRATRYETALGHRDSPFVLHSAAMIASPERMAPVKAFMAQFKAELDAHINGVYMNFLGGEEARQRTAQAYSPEGLARLKAVKAAYDPDNQFSHSYELAGEPVRE
jgi:FAD/FMN-containing dehydrogenase